MTKLYRDDGLEQFAAEGQPALPAGGDTLERDGARLWFARFGEGPVALLLHGGMGNANNFGFQVPALMAAGFSVVVMDSRGHGRSSWDGGDFSYSRMGMMPLLCSIGWGSSARRSLGGAMGRVPGLPWPRRRRSGWRA